MKLGRDRVRALLMMPGLFFAFTTLIDAQLPPKLDYQKIADGARWSWLENRGGPVQGTGKYTLQITAPPNGPLAFTILDGNKALYTWQGSIYTVYQVAGENLYYVDSIFTHPGGTVVAVELATGKILWKAPLKALQDSPSKRNNLTRFNLDVQLPVITITGWEAAGRYIEIKDAADGKTVGHKLFPATTQPGDL